MKNKSAFSLIEVLIYTAIIAIVGTLFGGILVSVTNIQSKQTASGEVNQQLSFVMNNIQRIIRESSVIDTESGVISSALTLRMQDPVKDKTLIYLENNQIMLKEGESTAVSLTSSAVKVDSLSFYKISSYPGHDSVQIDLTMSYNTENPSQTFSQKLSSAVARVSAATFDADLIPGATNNYDLGLSSLKWKNLYLSGDLTIGAKTTLGNLASDPTGAEGMIYYNTVSKKFRGYANGMWGNLGESQTIPQGMITMWSGTLASIPSGWQLCDGTNGTPDLRDKFVYGTSVGENPGTTGGSSSHTHNVNLWLDYYWHQTLGGSCTGDSQCGDLINPSAPINVTPDTYSGYGSKLGNLAPGVPFNMPLGSAEFTRNTLIATQLGPYGGQQYTERLGVSGQTDSLSNLPPYYKIAYIMKL